MVKRLLLILTAACTLNLQAEDCANKIAQCRLVIDDYKVQVGLLEQRGKLLEQQRDEAVKRAASPEMPAYFWILTGALAGSLVVLYTRK